MSEVKRVLKSIGAAVLALIVGISVVGLGIHLLLKMSDRSVVIMMLSFFALVIIAVVATFFYGVVFEPESGAPPEIEALNE